MKGRHGPGINKEGGVAWVMQVHEDGSLDVKLVIPGNVYRKLGQEFVRRLKVKTTMPPPQTP